MKTLKKTSLIAKGLVLGASLLWVPTSAVAGPHGFDLHNTLSPKAAGMAGTNIAGNNSGPVEAVFGNPANLADFYNARTGGQTGTNFTFGATLLYPDANAEHTGAVTGAIRPGPTADSAYDVDSTTDIFPVPQIALTQDLSGVGVPIVLGAGLSVISGIGVDWRRDPGTLGAGAELVILGVNLGAGYEVSPAFDVGFAATISYATLDAVVGGSSGLVHDIGFRATLGGDYHLSDSTDIGFYYQTELKQNYNDFLLLSNGCDAAVSGCGTAFVTGANGNDAAGTAISNQQAEYSNLDVEQPSNIAFGISHKFNDDLRIAADVIYKQWSEASFWKRLYHDQTAVSVGGEYDHGAWTFRAGYGYANDPKRERVEALSLEGYNYVCTGTPGFGGSCLPLTQLDASAPGSAATGVIGRAFWSWFQAMNTPVIYKHRLTAGFTYHGFLAPFLDLDMHAGYQFREKEEYSTAEISEHTELDVKAWHTGFALTWAF